MSNTNDQERNPLVSDFSAKTVRYGASVSAFVILSPVLGVFGEPTLGVQVLCVLAFIFLMAAWIVERLLGVALVHLWPAESKHRLALLTSVIALFRRRWNGENA